MGALPKYVLNERVLQSLMFRQSYTSRHQSTETARLQSAQLRDRGYWAPLALPMMIVTPLGTRRQHLRLLAPTPRLLPLGADSTTGQ